MITLSVISFHGSAYTGAPLSAVFCETGGTIGRSDNNLLVLPDPDRTISRVHAQIAWRAGQFLVQDRGSNPITVNGQPLGAGGEQVLRPGDELQIGGFGLRVTVGTVPQVKTIAQASAAAPDDIFAGLFGAAAAGRPAVHNPMNDPFAMPQPAATPAWQLPQQPSGNHPLAAPPAARPAAAASGGIPADWDPFGSVDGGGSNSSPAQSLRDVAQGLQRPAETSLDQMFGLAAPLGGHTDPLAGSSLYGDLSGPNTAADADPMRSLGGGGRAVAAQSEPDFGSDLYAPMPLPKTTPSARLMADLQAPTAAPTLGQFSWGDSTEEAASGRTIIRPVAKAKHTDFGTLDAAPAPPPRRMQDNAANADHAALLQALLTGLGLDENDLDLQLTPALMGLIGRLLRESTQGTVDLLVARAALKREVRAEVTMIVARENNPLKFSPSADVALRHLLGKPTRGFMPPAEAMLDAYQDLRAHQFGMLAGMRAALEGVLGRFDPAHLEGRLTQKSMLASLVPATRKARMWELFNELYAQIRAEAADDFQQLFGKAFLQAYEAHIDALHQEHR